MATILLPGSGFPPDVLKIWSPRSPLPLSSNMHCTKEDVKMGHVFSVHSCSSGEALSAHIDLLLGLWTAASAHCYPSQQHLSAILLLRSIRVGRQWMTQHIEVIQQMS